MPQLSDPEYQRVLTKVHELRHRAMWGKSYDVSQKPWPSTPQEWRQTPHGAPWDTQVEMAEWLLKLARKMRDEDLL